jgi:hypothetical protein
VPIDLRGDGAEHRARVGADERGQPAARSGQALGIGEQGHRASSGRIAGEVGAVRT